MSNLSLEFNCSPFGRWVNSPAGRVFRVAAGLAFLSAGIVWWPHPLAIASLLWAPFPLSAGLLDICWVSFALGGPLRGDRVRADEIGDIPSSLG